MAIVVKIENANECIQLSWEVTDSLNRQVFPYSRVEGLHVGIDYVDNSLFQSFLKIK